MPLVFDVYGTLLDVDAAAREAAAEPGMAALEDNWAQLSASWRQRQLSYSWLRTLMGEYIDFWQITSDALDVTLNELEISDADVRERLLQLYTRLSAYDEVPEQLRLMKEQGHQLGVLSNGSPSMLQSALESAKILGFLDQVLSVDDIGIYKPDRRVYAQVTEAYGCAPGDVTFFSSNNWDVAGAGTFGFRTIWVNRAGRIWDDLPRSPDHVVSSIKEAMALIS
ncbi:MAG: haloacid dehalogenase type II [Alphaproteobacteria bacterium]|jgi:2-haloacid dehalogenase|nr:haloacid dehalogenase type II [Alphaproteobacteria bacterium]